MFGFGVLLLVRACEYRLGCLGLGIVFEVAIDDAYEAWKPQ